jgi:hypothetical protein
MIPCGDCLCRPRAVVSFVKVQVQGVGLLSIKEMFKYRLLENTGQKKGNAIR